MPRLIVAIAEAVAETGGGKAGALGALRRAGLPVPDGFVVPFDVYRAGARDLELGPLASGPGGLDAVRRAIETGPLPAGLLDALARGLGELGDPPVAVRSSASGEDTADASAAGQHDSVLAVRGTDDVADAVRACWASLHSSRATAYRTALGHRSDLGDRSDVGDDRSSDEPVMAVLVQHLVDAAVSGVMFTPAGPDEATEIEASWGLGPSVVGGTVTPDAYRVTEDGAVTGTVSDKRTRLDRHRTQLVISDVPAPMRGQPTLDDTTVRQLARLGREVAVTLDGAQDVEWAIADGRIWLLQARPVTATTPPPPPSDTSVTSPAALTGTPGSHGIVTGTARIVRGPSDFTRVCPGDILVCPYTDPAWTPLLRIAAGVVTETGGVLSHAAIVAREHGIPAVLGVPNATARIDEATTVTVDGATGTVTTAPV